MKKSQSIIDFTQKKNEKVKNFAIIVHSELMAELIAGDIDPMIVYDILTREGKLSVKQRMN